MEKSETNLSRNMMPGCTKKYSSYDSYTGNTCTVRKNIQPGIWNSKGLVPGLHKQSSMHDV